MVNNTLLSRYESHTGAVYFLVKELDHGSYGSFQEPGASNMDPK